MSHGRVSSLFCGPRTKRYQTSYHLEVVDQSSGELLGYLVDVSQDGLKLTSPRSFSSGERLKLRISLPPEYFEQPFLACETVVRWSKPLVGEKYHVGFAVNSLELPTSSLTCQLINIFGSREREAGFLARMQEYIEYEHQGGNYL